LGHHALAVTKGTGGASAWRSGAAGPTGNPAPPAGGDSAGPGSLCGVSVFDILGSLLRSIDFPGWVMKYKGSHRDTEKHRSGLDLLKCSTVLSSQQKTQGVAFIEKTCGSTSCPLCFSVSLWLPSSAGFATSGYPTSLFAAADARRMITMADAVAQIEELVREADAELAQVKDGAALEQFRIKYLGSNGKVKGLMKLMGGIPKEEKPAFGQKANGAKSHIEGGFEAKKQSLNSNASEDKDYVDVTEPGRQPGIGNRHILMKVVDELVELFARMGFAVADGPEVEDEFHNFIALNIPESHPARDPLDNFYLEKGSGVRVQGSEGKAAAASAASTEPRILNPEPSLRLLRTQTSTVQIRVMEKQKPPIRVVIPGRVYRPDTVDATHLFMFHQLEALVVDKGVSMVDLKSTVLQFVRGYFGEDAKVRFRPSFFPFTEPSAEVDVWFEDKQKWIELGGCGMVHPNVLQAVNIDPEEYTGWAFGFGIERIAMRKYNITDIRHFVENDVRFLRQF